MRKVLFLLAIGVLLTAAQVIPFPRQFDNRANIVDFGADPTGVADSTAAIQAAIDSLSGSNRTAYCPDGTYKVSNQIFEDLPGNARGADGTHGPAWISGGGYNINDTVNSVGIAYINLTGTNTNTPPASDLTNWRVFNWNGGTTYAAGAVVSFGGTPWKSLVGSNTNNQPNTSPAFWQGWWILNSINSNMSLTFTGNPGQGSAGNSRGCVLNYTFNHGTLFNIGPGQGMTLANVELRGVAGGYGGNQPSAGIGVCVLGGPGGANRTKIQNIEVDNVNTSFETDCALTGQLGAENSWEKVFTHNCVRGIFIATVNNDINDVIEPSLSCVINFTALAGPGVSVEGGNLSYCCAASSTFAVSGTSALTVTPLAGSLNQYTFTTTLGAETANGGPGGSNISSCATNVGNCILGAWNVLTPWFGPVPLQMIGYNSSTHVATFQIYQAWANWNIGGRDATATTDLQAEVQAATLFYGVEQSTVFVGNAFHVKGMHIENDTGCINWFTDQSNFAGDAGSRFESIRFNTPINGGHFVGKSLSNPQFGFGLCQQSFPFIRMTTSNPASWSWVSSFMGYRDGNLGAIIDFDDNNASTLMCRFEGMGANILNPIFRQISNDPGNFLNDKMNGGCIFDANPYLATGINTQANQSQNQGVKFKGWFPDSSTHPRIRSSFYTTLQSISGANSLGSYPVVNGSTIYSVLDNAIAVAGKFVQSAHVAYSYGRNITTTDNASLNWTFKGQSPVVLADATTLGYLFPGLGITLNNGSGSGDVHYIVTSVVPQLSLDGGTHPGYFTVIQPSGGTGPYTDGVKTTTYSCPGNCPATIIGQDAYVWKTLTLQ